MVTYHLTVINSKHSIYCHPFHAIYKVYLFLTVRGLQGCSQAFSSCRRWGLLFFAVLGLLIAVASHCSGFSLQWLLLLQSTGFRLSDSVVVVQGLSCPKACGIFLDKGSTWVACFGRGTSNHCTSRVVHFKLTKT